MISRPRIAVFVLISSLLSLSFLEVFSYCAIRMIDHTYKTDFRSAVYKLPPKLTPDSVSKEIDMLYGWRGTPNGELSPRYSNWGNVTLDSDGFSHNGITKGPEYRNAIQVATFGGSTMAGLGVSSNKATIPARLESMLNKKGIQYDIHNYGVLGYNSFQELMLMEFEAVSRVDQFIVFDGINDMFFLQSMPKKYPYTRTLAYGQFRAKIQEAINQKKFGTSMIDPAYLQLTATTFLAKIISDRIKAGSFPTPNPSLFYTREKIEPSVQAHIDNWRSMIGLALAHHKKIMLILQPTLFYKKTLSPHEKYLESNLWSSTPFKAESDRIYLPMLRVETEKLKREFKSNPNVKIIDLSTLFEAESQEIFSHDYWHQNDRGNELIAESLAKNMF